MGEPMEEKKPEISDIKMEFAEFDMEETNSEESQSQTSIETARLTWHQAKAEFELVQLNSTQDYFTYQESLSIYTFLLDEIRSRNPDRLGRVAKRRVEIGDRKVWSRYKRNYCGRREIGAYRGHFRAMCGKIHDFPGLSETEKLDLYYGLAIKVPKNYREKLIELYDVEFDDQGIIIGSSKMTHWDVVHPDTDREDDDDEEEEDDRAPRKKRRKTKWLRFSEREDGVLWEYLLKYVNENDGEKPPVVSKKFWEEFKEEYENNGATWQRVPETYRGRYFKFLAPNLHLMPFDIETKAALYQSLEISVHKDFRAELINATGVTLNDEGLVTSYANRPAPPLVLQSRHYESVIGISSVNRVSILRNPHTCDQDTVPYTEKEEKEIWEFLRRKIVGPKGKSVRIRQKLTGMTLWREFQGEVKTRRFTRSLIQHFNEEMIQNILGTDYDLKIKLELLFALDVELDDDTLNFIRANTTTLHLNTKGAIRYAAGNGFAIGKSLEKPVKIPKKLLKDLCWSDSQNYSMFEDVMEQKVSEKEIKTEEFFTENKPDQLNLNEIKQEEGAILMPAEPEIDEKELAEMGISGDFRKYPNNSRKFPYLPIKNRAKPARPRVNELLEKRRIQDRMKPRLSNELESTFQEAMDEIRIYLYRMNEVQDRISDGQKLAVHRNHIKLNSLNKAREYYELSSRINPADGAGWNQLGVTAGLRAQSLEAVYFYTRALHSTMEFSAASSSLTAIFKKFANRDTTKPMPMNELFLACLAKIHFLMEIKNSEEVLEAIGKSAGESKQMIVSLLSVYHYLEEGTDLEDRSINYSHIIWSHAHCRLLEILTQNLDINNERLHENLILLSFLRNLNEKQEKSIILEDFLRKNEGILMKDENGFKYFECLSDWKFPQRFGDLIGKNEGNKEENEGNEEKEKKIEEKTEKEEKKSYQNESDSDEEVLQRGKRRGRGRHVESVETDEEDF